MAITDGGKMASSTKVETEDRFIEIIDDPWYQLLVFVQDAITRSSVAVFSEAGLRNLHLPMTTHSISSPMGLGSDSSPVEIELFEVPTFLPDSMQFLLEYGCRFNEAGAHYLMPSFRGEVADETHLCQFFHAEAEITGPLDDAMLLAERYLRGVTTAIVDELGGRIESMLGQDLAHVEAFLSTDPIPRITMAEAVEFLATRGPGLLEQREPGFQVLTRGGERALMEDLGGYCWVVEPEHLAVPFYQAYSDEERTHALAADLLMGLGETVGLGQRHARADEVREALARHQVDSSPYEWYIRMRERFPMQTSGFGIGIERYVCWLLKNRDIRDCQLLERYNGAVTIP